MKNRSINLISCLASLALTTCTPHGPNDAASILLFTGTGTSPNDVKAVEAILKDSHLDYSTVNSPQLNRMSEARLMACRLLIVPGGNYITMGRSLTPGTTTNIRKAVQGGLNYLGICAGGLLAGIPSESAERCMAELRAVAPEAAIIGEVIGKAEGAALVRVEG